jgi:hypothetical protein
MSDAPQEDWTKPACMAIPIIAKIIPGREPVVAFIKRLIRSATETPLAQGLALERNLFLKLCVSEAALARMRSYEGANITSPSRSIEVETRSASRG